MDFATVPEVTEMLQRRGGPRLFGYAEGEQISGRLTPVGGGSAITLSGGGLAGIFPTGVVPTISPLSAS